MSPLSFRFQDPDAVPGACALDLGALLEAGLDERVRRIGEERPEPRRGFPGGSGLAGLHPLESVMIPPEPLERRRVEVLLQADELVDEGRNALPDDLDESDPPGGDPISGLAPAPSPRVSS